ncbi:unnamed protein product [Ilex paraguariensis]|uniref:Uncharacterized protein n=1 Tax=Ilex paraguariensis TaxID=185542 RepID=A0ABC8U4G7_9AQUA
MAQRQHVAAINTATAHQAQPREGENWGDYDVAVNGFRRQKRGRKHGRAAAKPIGEPRRLFGSSALRLFITTHVGCIPHNPIATMAIATATVTNP